MSSFLRRNKLVLIPAFAITLCLLFLVTNHKASILDTVSYATRPLWDVADGPKTIIPHYHADGMKMNEHTCGLHDGWKLRSNPERIVLMDATLMSSELDLLEIRMNELDSVVDHFFIIESNATFTGLPKQAYFKANRARFAKFDHKIVYRFLPGYALRPGQSPWDVERDTRIEMSSLLNTRIAKLPAGTKPLVLMSDIDEIPAVHTLQLLKACDFGASIHLQLRNFLYSFEWYLGPTSWRASVHEWTHESYYRHSKSGDRALADAGWHCSYCFRSIPEYIVKMTGFSHADRIAGRVNLLDPKRIQDTICKGRDIFGMLPESYSYVDFFSQMHLEPLTSAVGLPRYLLENAERFRFLLPGGCKRPAVI